MAMATVTPQQLRQWMTAFLTRVAVPEEEAQLIAGVRIEAALRDPMGFDLFAARNLVHVVERLQAGGLNPRPALRVVQTAGALALVDGDAGIGQLVGVRAMELCLRLAQTHGIALVGARRSSSLGAMAYYAMMALSQHYIGCAATNTELRIGMPPWGGVTPTLGNNPFAVAIPREEGPPIVLDMSLMATEPQTVQPGTLLHRQALLGGGQVARPVMGGHKGYALAVVLEILCGVLTGAGFGLYHAQERLEAPATPPDLGHLFLALDVQQLLPLPLFQKRLTTLIQQIYASEQAPGSAGIVLPGELEAARREARLQRGIPITAEAFLTLQTLARTLGVPLEACM
jgi:LDH2 family malate/lactate/ureidoglycolate dehydrogenase